MDNQPKPPVRQLKIAVCGTRGIPACYGGFETFAEELSTRLAARGHRVIVYGRAHLYPPNLREHRGVALRMLWAPRHKYLETPVHALLSLIELAREPVDVILVCNAANSPFIWIPRLFRGTPVTINVDGIERLRAKWNSLGKLWYLLGERCAVRFADAVISDAEVIRDYYRQAYSAESRVIRYGCQELAPALAEEKIRGLAPASPAAVLAQEQLEPGRYILYVSRLEPENNAHIVIEAYRLLNQGEHPVPLVIVGDAPYAREYIRSLKELAGPGVQFLGYRFGDEYKALQLGALVYIQATEVGGTHPALVEAMGFANCIIANGTPENVEVIADAGLVYAKNSASELAQQLTKVLADPQLVAGLRRKAYERARQYFDWDKIANAYEDLFYELTGAPKSG